MRRLRAHLKRYGKAYAAVVVAMVVAGASATSGNGNVSGEEWFQIIMAGGTAAGVWLVPAFPQYPTIKTVLAGLMAGLTAASSVVLDGISSNDVLNVIIAVVGVVFIGVVPARSGPTDGRVPDFRRP